MKITIKQRLALAEVYTYTRNITEARTLKAIWKKIEIDNGALSEALQKRIGFTGMVSGRVAKKGEQPDSYTFQNLIEDIELSGDESEFLLNLLKLVNDHNALSFDLADIYEQLEDKNNAEHKK